jgi:hypothetical protein
MTGSSDITPEQAAALLAAPPKSPSPLLLPVINDIQADRHSILWDNNVLSHPAKYLEWADFIGADQANLAAAEQIAISIVDLANHWAGKQELSPELKGHLAQLVLSGSFDMGPQQAADVLAEPSGAPSPLIMPVVTAILLGSSS